MLKSIYFGGGTPSILEVSELQHILDTLGQHYTWDDSTEITLEANPDDLTDAKIEALKEIGVNRLSIGIQSFFDVDLRYMNRAHDASEAIQVVESIMKKGFRSITCDLIYGSPTTSDDMLKANIVRLIDAGIPHISAYSLTVEEGTALHHMIRHGKLPKPMDDVSVRQFDIIMEKLGDSGYDHYEISNYALEGHHAVHNTSYWKGQAYLGIGPSAHSYNGIDTRSWNIANNPKYIKAINQGASPSNEELLTLRDRYNEYILTKIRTKEGVSLNYIRNNFNVYLSNFISSVEAAIKAEHIYASDDVYRLTHKGKHVADNVSMNFFIVES